MCQKLPPHHLCRDAGGQHSRWSCVAMVSVTFQSELLVGGIASAGYIDRVEVYADVGQLVAGQDDIGRTYVFGYPFDMLRPGDWHYPRLLCQQPSEGDACRGGMFALGESLDIFDQHHIVPEVVRPEAGDGRCVPMSFSSCLLMFGMFLRWCEVSPACRGGCAFVRFRRSFTSAV